MSFPKYTTPLVSVFAVAYNLVCFLSLGLNACKSRP